MILNYFINGSFYKFGTDEACTFEFPIRPLKFRTPAEVVVLMFMTCIIATAVTSMKMLYTVGSIEFGAGSSVAGNHDDRFTCTPGQP